MNQNSEAFRGAKQEAYRYLRARGRTARELRDRLRRRGHGVEVIEAVLHDLEAEGYVNDRKLALEWARYRLQQKPMGRRRLAWELRGRGVEGELLAEVLRTVYTEFDEVALAEQAARKRLRVTSTARPSHEGQRLTRSLLGLGFELDTIGVVIMAIYPSPARLEIIDDADTF